jgi:hypothetical protein
MVDALGKTHRMLRPGGLMIEVHEVPGEVDIEVHSSNRITTVGRPASRTDFLDERQASAAVETVIERGLFSPEGERIYDFRAHFESLDALRRHMVENWEDTYLPDEVATAMTALVAGATGPTSIVIRHTARMRLLRKA